MDRHVSASTGLRAADSPGTFLLLNNKLFSHLTARALALRTSFLIPLLCSRHCVSDRLHRADE